jgi:hypothetical protein
MCDDGLMDRWGIHMPVKNRFAELHAEITAWRRDIHASRDPVRHAPHRALVARKS